MSGENVGEPAVTAGTDELMVSPSSVGSGVEDRKENEEVVGDGKTDAMAVEVVDVERISGIAVVEVVGDTTVTGDGKKSRQIPPRISIPAGILPRQYTSGSWKMTTWSENG